MTQGYSLSVHAKFTLANLPPRLFVLEPHPLPEISEEVHQNKQRQEVGHLLITGVLHPAYVRVQVPHADGVSPQEVVERLLEVQEVINCRRGVSLDKGGPLQAGDNLTAHHVWSVEAYGLYVPYLRPLSRDHSHSPLGFSGRGGICP